VRDVVEGEAFELSPVPDDCAVEELSPDRSNPEDLAIALAVSLAAAGCGSSDDDAATASVGRRGHSSVLLAWVGVGMSTILISVVVSCPQQNSITCGIAHA
jgi:hypothetical protein